MTGCVACAPGAMTIWSSLFPSSNCWHASRRLADAATPSSRRLSCMSAISRSIWCRGPPAGAARTFSFFPGNSSFWSIWFATKAASDRAIMTEYFNLQDAYERSGRDGLIALIQRRIADKSFADNVYILVDPSSAALAGNLKAWPSTVTAASGWTEFRASEPMADATSRPLLRAMLGTFPSGDRLLLGMDISDLDSFTDQIKKAVLLFVALIFVVAGVASILVTRRTVGRIEAINATSRAIMLSGLDKRIPLRGSNDEWDRVAENLNLMLDRIETLMNEV